jgi:hypothetical protein
MTEVIHGTVSGLIWSAILGSCLIAFAAVVSATASAKARVRNTAMGTICARDASPILDTARLGRTATFSSTVPLGALDFSVAGTVVRSASGSRANAHSGHVSAELGDPGVGDAGVL